MAIHPSAPPVPPSPPSTATPRTCREARAAPLVIWGTVVILGWDLMLATAPSPFAVALAEAGWALAGVVVVAAGVCLVAVRRRRGHTVFGDAFLPAIWLLSVQERHLLEVGWWLPLGLALFLSLAYVFGGWRLFAGGFRRLARIPSLPWIGSGVLLWIHILVLPYPVAGDGLDPSWLQAYNRFLKVGLQAGTDYCFTYGPLGGCYFPHYDPALFGLHLAWQAFTKTVIVVFLVLTARRLPNSLARALWAVTVLWVVPLANDALHLLGMVAIAAWGLREGHRHPIGLSLGILFWVLLSLTKFTHFLLAAALTGVLAVTLGRTRSPRWGFFVVSVFVMEFALMWSLAGQRPATLLPFLSSSYELAAAYSRDFQIYGASVEVAWGMAAGILALLTVITAISARPRSFARGAVGVIIALTVLLSWKIGFVRQDGHEWVYFSFLAGVIFLLLAKEFRTFESNIARFAVQAGVALVLGCALTGLHVAGRKQDYPLRPGSTIVVATKQALVKLKALAFLPAFCAERERARDALAERHRMPETRAEVGNAPVDMISYEQGVLFLNHLEWRPRPAFQSYVAVPREFAERNAAFYRSPEAPRYVLFKSQPTDGRHPTSEDALLLPELFRHYRPVLTEHSYLLLARRPAPVPPPPAIVLRRSVALAEWVDVGGVPGQAHLLRVATASTTTGALKRILYKGIVLGLETRTARGHLYRDRLLTEPSRSGFILNPVLRNQKDFVGWFSGIPQDRVTALRITLRHGSAKDLKGAVTVTLLRDDSLIHEQTLTK